MSGESPDLQALASEAAAKLHDRWHTSVSDLIAAVFAPPFQAMQARIQELEKALSDAASEVNCAGPVAHRIRVMKAEHGERVQAMQARLEAVENERNQLLWYKDAIAEVSISRGAELEAAEARAKEAEARVAAQRERNDRLQKGLSDRVVLTRRVLVLEEALRRIIGIGLIGQGGYPQPAKGCLLDIERIAADALPEVTIASGGLPPTPEPPQGTPAMEEK